MAATIAASSLLLLHFATTVLGHSNGAPECVRLPGHGATSLKQEDFAKMYETTLTKTGDDWTFRLKGKDGNKFKGFLIKPDDANPGTFTGGDTSAYQPMKVPCSGGITHVNPSEKAEFTVNFKPNTPSDHVMLKLVVVKSMMEVWEEMTIHPGA